MKKLFKLLIVSTLAVILAFSTVACSCGGESGGNGEGTSNSAASSTVKKYDYNGTHIRTAPDVDTEDYIIKDGNFLYTVIVPKATNTNEIRLRNEFDALLQRAMGYTPKVANDSEVNVFDPNQLYISIGDNAYTKSAGITVDPSVTGANGVVIKTIGKNIFLTGGYDTGALNAIYTFFEICFNYRQFNRNTIKMDTDVQNMKLKNFDVLEVPDIQYSSAYHKELQWRTPSQFDYYSLGTKYVDDKLVETEIKYHNERRRNTYSLNSLLFLMPAEDGSVGSSHNTSKIFDKNKSGVKDNPLSKDWFASSGRQICWTAHGNPEAFEAMVDFFVEEAKTQIIKWQDSLNLQTMMIGNEDGGGFCNCEACSESFEAAGKSYQGSQFVFVNAALEKLLEWFDKPENAELKAKYPNFKLAVFGYDRFKKAPVTYNEAENKYEAINGFEPMKDRVVVYYTTYISYRSIYDDALSGTREDIQSYSDIGVEIWTWNYIMAYNSESSCDPFAQWNSELIKYFAANNIGVTFSEVVGTGHPAKWSDLLVYVMCQISWNSDLDSSKLIEDYCDAVYGMVSKEMQEILKEDRLAFQFMQKQYELDNAGSIWQQNSQRYDERQYSYAVMKPLIEKVYAVWEKLEPLKAVDYQKYLVVKEHIDVATYHLFYNVFNVYGSTVAPPITAEEKAKIKEFLIEYGNTHSLHKGFKLSEVINW